MQKFRSIIDYKQREQCFNDTLILLQKSTKKDKNTILIESERSGH